MTPPTVLTTLEFLGLTVEVTQVGERRGGRSLALRLAGTHIDLGQYEVTTISGQPQALDQTFATWEACYEQLVFTASRLHVARQMPSIGKQMTPDEWLCVMPRAAYLGRVVDGVFEITCTPSGLKLGHALSSVRGLVTVPGVGCWRTIDQAARDLLLLAALDDVTGVQGAAA